MASSQTDIAWPKKTREIRKYVVDSRLWNDFEFRDNDIVISTWAKSGTTLTQQIVAQLVFDGADVYGPNLSPWIDLFVAGDERAVAAAQTHRRFLKTHIPIDTIVYSPKAKYLFIGRDGRDVFWSWYNHWNSYLPEDLAHTSSFYPDEPPIGYPSQDMRTAFHDWLDSDAYPNPPFFSHTQGWFDARHLPNFKLMHFTDLRADLPGQIRSIADFLGIPINPDRFETILRHCSIEYMRQKAETEALHMKGIWKDGANSFFFKGTNGRWKDVLTADDLARYDAEVKKRLSPAAARWLETGKVE